jgi:hypothetical protein
MCLLQRVNKRSHVLERLRKAHERDRDHIVAQVAESAQSPHQEGLLEDLVAVLKAKERHSTAELATRS